MRPLLTALLTSMSQAPSLRRHHSTFSPFSTTPTSCREAQAHVSTETVDMPLMIEYDEFYVSDDGIARTFYELHATGSTKKPPFAIEERYDLKQAKKTFVLRKPAPDENSPHSSNEDQDAQPEVLSRNSLGAVDLGKVITSVHIQEIDQGVFGSAGTGATTWEASLAMALYFGTQRHQLSGNVVELGCGVGVGSILNILASTLDHRERSHVKSVTLTDGNDEVLQQCRSNVHQALAGVPPSTRPPISIKNLEWKEAFESQDRCSDILGGAKYKTVIACDCAYRHQAIKPLSETLASILQPEGTIHMFGPYNRSAFLETCRYLSRELNLDVTLEWVEINRYRLKPASEIEGSGWSEKDDGSFASQCAAKFLHVIAHHKRDSSNHKADESLFDID
jgi:hypothetical protein